MQQTWLEEALVDSAEPDGKQQAGRLAPSVRPVKGGPPHQLDPEIPEGITNGYHHHD